MAQNIKIVLDNVEKQTPNNVGFSDTITIKGNSKIALTSFNASFDINKQGQDILGQSFIMNLNETLYNDPRTVTIPDKTYFNETELQLEITKQMNKVFSAYEKDATDPRVFTGYSLSLTDNNVVAETTGFGGSVKKDKMVIGLNVMPLSPFVMSFEEGSLFYFDENGELTTDVDDLDFLYNFNSSTLNPGSLADAPFLFAGGGVAFQYNMRFNLPNSYTAGPLTSYVKLTDQNGDSMALHYNAIRRVGQNAPLIEFYVEKVVGGVTSAKETISNVNFYNWVTLINDNFLNPSAGPWSQSNLAKNDSYFLWCVRDGKWIIVYYDANTSTYKEVYINGVAYNLSDNYTFTKSITALSQNLVVIKEETTLGTFSEGNIKKGSATLKTTFNFENAPRLREIYSFGVVGQMLPENMLPAQYTPNGEVDFYPSQDFEIACEIDTIKIKNYVGTKGNKNAGRKNIIAYFTPETVISQSSFIYRFDPSSPIYLAVDSKQDIDFNSLNIRFINTYTNRTFTADTITCVLTNV